MTQTVRYVVNGSIESTDSALLDTIQSALPDEDDVKLGNEYNETRQSLRDEDGNEIEGERLSARMTFATQAELDGTDVTVTPKEAALALFNQVANADLANKADGWELQLYRSPEGGTTVQDVQEWYEENPSQQPERTLKDGTTEQYIPSSWNPSNHMEQYESDT